MQWNMMGLATGESVSAIRYSVDHRDCVEYREDIAAHVVTKTARGED